MKQSEIQIGAVYLARVSGELVRVIPVSTNTGDTIGRKTFNLRRLDSGARLPKPRTAAALRATPFCACCGRLARFRHKPTSRAVCENRARTGHCEGPAWYPRAGLTLLAWAPDSAPENHESIAAEAKQRDGANY